MKEQWIKPSYHEIDVATETFATYMGIGVDAGIYS